MGFIKKNKTLASIYIYAFSRLSKRGLHTGWHSHHVHLNECVWSCMDTTLGSFCVYEHGIGVGGIYAPRTVNYHMHIN